MAGPLLMVVGPVFLITRLIADVGERGFKYDNNLFHLHLNKFNYKIHKLFIGLFLCFLALGIAPYLPKTAINSGWNWRNGFNFPLYIEWDLKDWSRNNWHGSIQGTDFKFVKDELFGNVLSLNGSSDTYISLPAESVTGEQTLSITGWIYLRSAKSGQLFFDFGKTARRISLQLPLE
jgi:hypothetical protein